MSNVKCFDVLNMVVEEANKGFAPQFVPDKNSYDILRGKCTIIDYVLEEFEGIAIDIEVDKRTMEIRISIECEDLYLYTREHEFYKILEVTKRVIFSTSEDKNLQITFMFPSIWNKEI